MAKAKFAVDDHVNHPASVPGASPSFPAGCGVVKTVNPDGTYTVTCDATGKTLTPNFKESDLSAA